MVYCGKLMRRDAEFLPAARVGIKFVNIARICDFQRTRLIRYNYNYSRFVEGSDI